MKLKFHIIFWVLVVLLLTAVFTPSFSSISEGVYFISMLLPVVLGTCYFFNYYLVPQFLLKRRYVNFLLYSFYMLIVSLYLEMVVIMLSFIFLAKYSYNNMSPVSSDVLVLAVTLYFVVFLFSFILLIRRNLHKEITINQLEKVAELQKNGYFSVKSERQTKKILYDEVFYIESLRDYVRIVLAEEVQVITREKISSLETRLPAGFIRVHRSFIINRDKISAYNRENILLGKYSVPVSRSYKEKVLQDLR